MESSRWRAKQYSSRGGGKPREALTKACSANAKDWPHCMSLYNSAGSIERKGYRCSIEGRDVMCDADSSAGAGDNVPRPFGLPSL